ncbi:hypothetical protein FACS189413_09060 [Bacteroidia bacterium]|nr:hypothetical protein FACS189413_09060 [Bacteroidia bacterium]
MKHKITLKRHSFIAFLLCIGTLVTAQTISVNNGIGTITLSGAGELATAINALADKSSVTELQVSTTATPPINAVDVTAINNLTALKTLDLSGIVVDGFVLPGALLKNNTTVETFKFPGGNNIGWEGGVFEGSALKGTFTIPKNVTNQGYIGRDFAVKATGITAFAVEDGSPILKAVDGVLYSFTGDAIYKYPIGKSGDTYTVQEGVTWVGQQAFRYTTLKKITFPATLQTFQHTSNHFTGATALEEIEVAPANTLWASTGGILVNSAEKQLYFLPPGNKAESLVIDGSLAERMTNGFFSNAKYLKRIIFTEGFKEISYACFKMNNALNDLPMLVEYIELPSTITTVGGEAFNSLKNLTQVICKATTPPYLAGHQVFREANGKNLRLGVPAESLAAYKASPWNLSNTGTPTLEQGGHEDNGVPCSYANINAVPGDQIVVYRTISYEGCIAGLQGAAVPGSQVKITSGEGTNGQSFSGWASEPAGVSFINSAASTTYFTMPEYDVTIRATFADMKPYSVIGATISQNGQAAVGSSVNLETAAQKIVNGNILYFQEWQINQGAGQGLVIDNPLAVSTSFVMIDGEVEIEAIYKAAYMVNVQGGNITTPSIEFFAGDEIAITASNRPNQVFTNWSADAPDVVFADAQATSTTFIMPDREVTITANFRGTGIEDLVKEVNLPYTIYNLSGIPVGRGITNGETVASEHLSDGVYIIRVADKAVRFIKK